MFTAIGDKSKLCATLLVGACDKFFFGVLAKLATTNETLNFRDFGALFNGAAQFFEHRMRVQVPSTL